jgi:hypothetical protein
MLSFFVSLLSSVGFSLRPNTKPTAIALLTPIALSFFSHRRRPAASFDPFQI